MKIHDIWYGNADVVKLTTRHAYIKLHVDSIIHKYDKLHITFFIKKGYIK